jgi:hypothetical protein
VESRTHIDRRAYTYKVTIRPAVSIAPVSEDDL